jgi:hypothetical protein
VTEAVARAAAGQFDFDALGRHAVKGHSPVEVWGLRIGARPAERT